LRKHLGCYIVLQHRRWEFQALSPLRLLSFLYPVTEEAEYLLKRLYNEMQIKGILYKYVRFLRLHSTLLCSEHMSQLIWAMFPYIEWKLKFCWKTHRINITMGVFFNSFCLTMWYILAETRTKIYGQSRALLFFEIS
jgi:hypothetical protein